MPWKLIRFCNVKTMDIEFRTVTCDIYVMYMYKNQECFKTSERLPPTLNQIIYNYKRQLWSIRLIRIIVRI